MPTRRPWWAYGSISNQNALVVHGILPATKAAGTILATMAAAASKAVMASRTLIFIDFNDGIFMRFSLLVLFFVDVNVPVAMMDHGVNRPLVPSVAPDGPGIRRWKCAKILISASSSSPRNRMELCSTTDLWCHRNRTKLSFQVRSSALKFLVIRQT